MNLITRIVIAAAIILVIVYLSPEAERDDQGKIVSEGSLGIFSVKVGDCLKQSISKDSKYEELGNVVVVPCNEPHESEVYHEKVNFPLFDKNEFPENKEEISEELYNYCLVNLYLNYNFIYDENFELHPRYSNLGIIYFFPTKTSWMTQNDKKVQCLLENTTGKNLIGKFSETVSGF